MDLDSLIRRRIRALRTSRGWTLDAMSTRSSISPSNLSRIETGNRRIAVDQLIPIARALGVTVDDLVAGDDDEDVIIRPEKDQQSGRTIWALARGQGPQEMSVAKMRIEGPVKSTDDMGVHPGRDWLLVLSGTALLHLGGRRIPIEAGNAAEFSTMTPHAIGALDGPVEILAIWSKDSHKAHAVPTDSRRR